MKTWVRILSLGLVASLTVVSILEGCAAKTVKDPNAPRAFIFPNGIYQHDVTMDLKTDDHKEQKFHFSGVVSLRPDFIRLVALAPLGTTLFRISEDRANGKIETQVYADSLKPFEKQMSQYYAMIRAVLTMPVEQNKIVKKLSIEIPNGPAEAYFDDFDKNNIPTRVEVDSSKFNLKIKVSGYEI